MWQIEVLEHDFPAIRRNARRLKITWRQVKRRQIASAIDHREATPIPFETARIDQLRRWGYRKDPSRRSGLLDAVQDTHDRALQLQGVCIEWSRIKSLIANENEIPC